MRTALSRSSQILVDGLGAERVAMALLAEVKSGLTLRSVVPADAATLWQWRNHPATRGVSRNQAEIPLDAHCRWVEKTLANPQILLLIGQIAGRDFGVIRFDRRAQGNIYEVSLYLDPTLHGLGLGAALLRAGEAALLSTFGAAVIHAEVLAANFASRRLFVACGYEADSPTTYFKSAVTNCTVPGQQAAVHDIDHPATP
jgi:RimJ/RimL family protein N-acetyltransferase